MATNYYFNQLSLLREDTTHTSMLLFLYRKMQARPILSNWSAGVNIAESQLWPRLNKRFLRIWLTKLT